MAKTFEIAFIVGIALLALLGCSKETKTVVGPAGIQGPAGMQGPAGPQGTPGVKAPLVLHATKLHIGAGSVFFPEEKSVTGNFVVPGALRMIAGIGSNDACAAKLSFDSVECCYSPTSTVNKPSTSTKGQALASLTYNLLSCTDGSAAGDSIVVATSVKLELNKADSSVQVNTLRAEVTHD